MTINFMAETEMDMMDSPEKFDAAFGIVLKLEAMSIEEYENDKKLYFEEREKLPQMYGLKIIQKILVRSCRPNFDPHSLLSGLSLPE